MKTSLLPKSLPPATGENAAPPRAALSARQRAWAIAGTYAGFATLWIIFSDRILLALAPDPPTFSLWSVYKGVAFVAVTSLILVLLITRSFQALAQAHKQLHLLNENLERKVAERTQALAAAAERAEAADRIKSAFLATMSHELRTPLNSIIGFTGIVLQGLAGPLTPEQTKQLGMVRGSARHLLALINDVLDLSKIEAGQLALSSQPFAIAGALQHCMNMIEPMASRKGLQLQLQAPAPNGMILTDQRRFEQVLLNLLNNAVKFTDRGGVTVQATLLPAGSAPAHKKASPTLEIRVTDTGIGIKPADIAQLFQPFHQVDAGLARQHEGTGLGLAICRRLTSLMGGTLSVESVWGEGSTFILCLPTESS